MANFDLICLALVAYNKNFQVGGAQVNVAWRHMHTEIIRISSSITQEEANTLRGQRRPVPSDQIEVINDQYRRRIVGWTLVELNHSGAPVDAQWASSYQHLPIHEFSKNMPLYRQDGISDVA